MTAEPAKVNAEALFGNGQILDAIREIAQFLRSEDLKAILAGVRQIVEFVRSLLDQPEPGPEQIKALEAQVAAAGFGIGEIAVIVQVILAIVRELRKRAQPSA